MGFVTPDEFLTQVTALYEESKSVKGSVAVSVKSGALRALDLSLSLALDAPATERERSRTD